MFLKEFGGLVHDINNFPAQHLFLMNLSWSAKKHVHRSGSSPFPACANFLPPRKQGHGQVLFFILRLFLIFHLWALSASEYFLFCIIPHQLCNKSSFTFPTFLIHSCIFLLNTVKPFFKQHWPSKRIPQGDTGWFCIRYEQLKARNNGGKCITFHTFTAKRFHSPTAEQV